MTGIIYGTGACTPSYIMDNNDIAKLVETSDEWIQERTGVAKRHIITEETTVSMAVQAGRRALENAGTVSYTHLSMEISCRFIMIHLLLDDGISSVNVNGLPGNVGSGIRTEVDGHAGKILVRISKTFLGNMA